jgi:hypothetical protein
MNDTAKGGTCQGKNDESNGLPGFRARGVEGRLDSPPQVIGKSAHSRE